MKEANDSLGGGGLGLFWKGFIPQKNIKYSQAWKKPTGARPARPAGPLAGPLAFIFPSCSPVLIFFFFPGIINELTKRGKQGEKKEKKKRPAPELERWTSYPALLGPPKKREKNESINYRLFSLFFSFSPSLFFPFTPPVIFSPSNW